MALPGRRHRDGGRRVGLLRAPLALLVLAVALGSACGVRGGVAPPPPGGDPVVGPEDGAVLLAGGGDLEPRIWEEFLDLAGGSDARIVVIPTAGTRERYDDDWFVFQRLRESGAEHVEILHTRDPEEADSKGFVAPLKRADGVWITGGRQGRLVDAYLGTRTHDALEEVLDRGGVVGGTSAGASIQASYLVRGDPETNQTVMAEGYEEGFGLLNYTAIDQHLHARDRQRDLFKVVAAHPDHIGIGIDEGTAVVIRGDEATVVGRGEVLIYTHSVHPREPQRQVEGDRFDLGWRVPHPTVVPRRTDESEDRPDEEGAREERELEARL